MLARVITIVALIANCALAQSTAFTYQGELKNNGQLATGPHDLRFRLFNASSGGAAVGSQVCLDNVQLSAGRFSASLDFGAVFASTENRYLEVDVRQDSGLDCTNATGFTTLPRQFVAPAPRATAASVANALAAPDGAPAIAAVVDNAGRVGIGTVTPTNPLSVAGAADFSGNVGIGTTTPGVPLHIVSTSPVPAIAVASPFAVLQLQDTGSNANQTGYVSYRNATGTETAWTGFGSAGDPDFSIVNARPSGDIVLNTLGGGNVKIGSGGQYFVPAADENLRILRGTIQILGTVFAGSGWTVSHNTTGFYTVTFNTPFASLPTITASAGTSGFSVVQSSNTVNGVTFTTRNSSGVTADTSITFIAAGPR